jgi:hypothetical protein
MDLHDHAVLGRHLCHLRQHMTVVECGFVGPEGALQRFGVKRFDLRPRKPCRHKVWHIMVGGGGASVTEYGTSETDRVEEPAKGGDVRAGHLRQPLRRLCLAGPCGVDEIVGAKRGNDAPSPTRCGDPVMLRKICQRGVRCCQGFDPEPVEQGAGVIFGIGEPAGDLIMYKIRAIGGEWGVDADHLVERVFHPHPCGSPQKRVPVLCEDAEDRATVAPFYWLADAHVLHRDSLRIEHAQKVMIGRQQQRGWVGKRRVLRPPCRVAVPVR